MKGELWAYANEAWDKLPDRERNGFNRATWLAGFVAGAHEFDPDNAREMAECVDCEGKS